MTTAQVVRVMALVGALGALAACPTAPPVIYPTSGPQTCPYTVTMMDTTQNATIHYTTDGSPVSVASSTYTAPISLDAAATVNAFATAPSMTASTTTTASYTCGEPTYSNVEFQITTGGDDARDDSEIDARLLVSTGTGSALGFVLKASGDQAWTSSNTRVFPLNPALPASAVGGVILTLVQHPHGVETADNWDMQTLRVSLYNQLTAPKCVVSAAGNPATRFTASNPTVVEHPGCSN